MTALLSSDMDLVHAAALAALPTKAARITYVCEHLVRPSTAEVLAMLSTYGYVKNPRAERPYVATTVTAWRRERGLTDTRDDLVPLSSDVLQVLDTQRSGVNVRTVSPVSGPGVHSDTSAQPSSVSSSSLSFAALSRSVSWAVVLIIALGISWWSLFDLATGFGVPVVLAAGVSLVFDAAALVCGHLAHRYALSPDSGFGPRVTMVALVLGSVYLNTEHALSLKLGVPGAVMFSAPAAVAVVLFELESGWRARAARRTYGRVPVSLPTIGRWGWIFHPLQSLVTLWRVSAARGRAVRSTALAE